jgi:hypothetical protein
MISIGAADGFRSRSLEVRSPDGVLGLSPCPELFWRRALSPHLPGERPPFSPSPLACPGSIGAPGNRGQIAPPTVQNYSTHVSSNFRSNSLKTNNWRTHQVTHKWRVRSGAFQRSGCAVVLNFPRSISCTEASPAARTKCRFSLALPESRRSRPASDSLSGGII